MNSAQISGFRMLAAAMTTAPRFTITPKDGNFEVRDNGKLAGIVGSYAAAEELISCLK